MKQLKGQPLLLRKSIRSAEVEPLRQETTAGCWRQAGREQGRSLLADPSGAVA